MNNLLNKPVRQQKERKEERKKAEGVKNVESIDKQFQ
jgi:hypothetical protein